MNILALLLVLIQNAGKKNIRHVFVPFSISPSRKEVGTAHEIQLKVFKGPLDC